MSGEARFVSRGLPRTEGWNGAAAFDEGRWRRNVKWKSNRLQFDLQVKAATRRSSGGTPLGKPPHFVVARSANPYSPLWGTDFFGKISASLPQDTLPVVAVDCGPSERQSAPCAQLRWSEKPFKNNNKKEN